MACLYLKLSHMLVTIEVQRHILVVGSRSVHLASTYLLVSIELLILSNHDLAVTIETHVLILFAETKFLL
jgi:hypothetical protein